ncbi:MAG: hypothetical protein ACRC6A_12655, partial [Fusobacteriaceae bacterium]
MVANSASLENNGTIEVKSGDQEYILEGYGEDDKLEWKNSGILKEYVAGMKGKDGSKILNGENGKIVLFGEGDGILVVNKSEAINKGTIELIAGEVKYLEETFNGSSYEYDVEGWAKVVGMRAEDNSTVINKGTIKISNAGIGMKAEEGGSTAINEGKIFITAKVGDNDDTIGMDIGKNSIGKNSGSIKIDVSIDTATGVEVSDGGSFINETNATIEIISNDNNSDNTNYYARNVIGIIIDSGDDDDDHFKTTAENKGVITISVTENRWGTGMLAKGEKAEIKNSGTINLSGDNLYGMLAYYGATATNEKTGIINVGGNSTGMLAYGEGSKIINLGTINVDKDNLNNSSENGVLNSAMKIENGATLENKGIINSESDVKIEIKNGGAYVVGTDRNGSYGKISAENINIDGKIKVSTEIAKGSYKDSYKLEDVLSAETITLDSKATSTSVLYDAKLEENKDGNVDATLSKNKSKVSDYTNTSFISTAKIFDKYFSDNEYNKLEDDQKEVIDTLFEYTSETEIENGGLNKALKSLTPTIYSNLGRQILETSETFKAQDAIAINSIGENSYNFTFLGEYRDVDSRKNIEGYESKLSGFVGAMSFG